MSHSNPPQGKPGETVHRNAFGLPIGAPVPGWTPRPRPPRTAMIGRYCRVEPLDVEAHATGLHAAFAEAPDGRDWTYMSVERFSDADVYRDWLKNFAAAGDPMPHAIIDGKTGHPVGIASLMRIDPASGVIEVGWITYSPRLQRTPAGTEAMYLMMRRAFDELGYRRYEWKCDSLNAPSRAAALRYGFTFEGIFRQAVVYKGRNRDSAWYSITDGEWPRVRKAFETWLAPDNFDSAGAQRRDLKAIRDNLD